MSSATVGRFEIQHELLSNPLFSVYKARAPKTQRIVAVYAVRLETIAGQQLAARFREAAKQASVLNSPNIASVYGGGTDAGLFLIAFEYVDGTSLRTLLDEGQEFSAHELIDLARQVCCGLDHAHHRGLFHNNLHPGNILVEADGTAKIMDFGVPKEVTFPVLDPLPDKFRYLSPEQVKGAPPDARSNVFSLGAILYELLTTKQAFPANNAEELRREILEEMPPAPHELNTEIPEAISRAVMKALAKDPGARQQRGSGLVFELESYRQAEGPPTPPVRAAAAVAPLWPAPVVSAPPPPPMPKPASVPAEPAGHVFQGEIPASPVQPPVPAAAAGLPSVFQSAEAQPTAVPVVPIKARAAAAVRDATTRLTSKEAEKRLNHFLARAVPVGAVLAGVLVILGIISFIQARIAARPAPEPAPVVAASAPAPAPADAEPAQAEPASAETQAEAEPEVVVIQSPDPTAKPRRRAAPKRAAIPASLSVPTGGIAINSVPEGAQIQIDGYGEPNWRTPYLAANIPAGPHTITLTKAGYATRAETVRVEGGKRASLAASLTELAGTVAVASEPAGAAVIVDGKGTGRVTPAQVVVTKGSHTFTVRKEGYFDYSTEAQVAPGQTVRVNAPLRAMGSTDDIQTAGGRFNKLITRQPKDMASLKIRTRPKGARIMINNRMMDKATPAEFFLHPGHYEIVLSLPGYKSLRKTVSVESTAKLVIDEALEQ